MEDGSNPPGKPGRKKNPKYALCPDVIMLTLNAVTARRQHGATKIVSPNGSFVCGSSSV